MAIVPHPQTRRRRPRVGVLTAHVHAPADQWRALHAEVARLVPTTVSSAVVAADRIRVAIEIGWSTDATVETMHASVAALKARVEQALSVTVDWDGTTLR